MSTGLSTNPANRPPPAFATLPVPLHRKRICPGIAAWDEKDNMIPPPYRETSLEAAYRLASVASVIAENLNTTLDTLSAADRHEVAVYLTKLEIENDPQYWKTIRSRTQDEDPSKWVSPEELN
jgi:hypothetical protein